MTYFSGPFVYPDLPALSSPRPRRFAQFVRAFGSLNIVILSVMRHFHPKKVSHNGRRHNAVPNEWNEVKWLGMERAL